MLHTLGQLWFNGLQRLRRPVAEGVQLCGLVPATQHTPDLFEALDAAHMRIAFNRIPDLETAR